MQGTLTPRQADVVEAIRSYRHLHGYAPTMQELSDQLGVSKVTIFEHVRELERKRVLRREANNARTLEVIGGESLWNDDRSTKFPLLGTIDGGSPLEAVRYREEVDLEEIFRCRNGVYVLRVRGYSMADDHLDDGDFVVIERRANARNGERVVAVLDTGECTLKRYYRDGDKVRLHTADTTGKVYEARIVDADRCKIVGVVIGLVRDCSR